MPVQKLNRAIKYRAYPTSEQQVLFAKTFGCVRFIWNHMLIDAQQFLDEAGTFFVPTPAKYKKEFPFLKEVDCHSDGYPSYLGKMLLEHYNTPELATALVDLGSLSMVRERLAPDEGETHRFDTPVRHGPKGGITTAYHRDRGDDLEIDSVVVDTPVVLKNAETLFLNILKEENITYGYLYNVADKLWYATDTVQDNRFFVLDENFIDAHT